MQARRRFAAIIGVFSAVLFVALAICASGLISLFGDLDVLAEHDAGPLIAPAMFVVATAVVFVVIAGVGSRVERPGVVITSLLSGVAVYFLFLIAGGTLYSLGKGRPLLSLLFFGANAGRPIPIVIAAIAVVVTAAALLLLSSRDAGHAKRTPRWPWERHGEE